MIWSLGPDHSPVLLLLRRISFWAHGGQFVHKERTGRSRSTPAAAGKAKPPVAARRAACHHRRRGAYRGTAEPCRVAGGGSPPWPPDICRFGHHPPGHPRLTLRWSYHSVVRTREVEVLIHDLNLARVSTGGGTSLDVDGASPAKRQAVVIMRGRAAIGQTMPFVFATEPMPAT